MSAAAVSLRSLGGAVRQALSWWGEGLAMALPSWAVALVLGDRRSVHLEVDETGRLRARLALQPFAETATAEALLACDLLGDQSAALRSIRSAARSRPVILMAPPDRVLAQEVMVPEAALENLQQAVAFGISTWTPFEADMLVYHADVLERRGEQARIRIRMILRTALGPYLAAARDARLPIRAVAFDRDPASCAEIGEPSNSNLIGRKIDLALVLAAILLGCALLVTLHLTWARELDELKTQIRAELADRSKQVAIEQKLSVLAERRRSVQTKRAKEPRISEIVAAAANAMPEGAAVSEFGWTGAQGRIVTAKAASQDVKAALAAVSLLHAAPPLNAGEDKVVFELVWKRPEP